MALSTVMPNITSRTAGRMMTEVGFTGGVVNIMNSSICIENPIVMAIPRSIPLAIATKSRTITSQKTINRISEQLTPMALNILYISASSRHLESVKRNKNTTAKQFMMTVMPNTYTLRLFCMVENELLIKSISNTWVCSGDIDTMLLPIPFRF